MRYPYWHRRKGDVDASPVARDLGKKLLGEMQASIDQGGPQTQVRRDRAIDGTLVEAKMVLGLPEVTFTNVRRSGVEFATGRDGFVTWPTDPDGETAYPASSPRILLVGEEYKDVRHPQYSGLFPNVTDPELGEVDGLGRAGNIDWQGDDGWRVSWYGPRNRYNDTGTQLHPLVFFKGQPLADARDFIDTDATILGAAVFVRGLQPWLLVVSEEFFFGRWEDVWAVKLRDPASPASFASPTAPRLEVDPDSYVYLTGRNHGDTNPGRHPWFFHPNGREGRIILSDNVDLLERIIRVVEDDGEPHGFSIERDSTVIPWIEVTERSGYSAGQKIAHNAKHTAITKRQHSVDLRSLAPPTPSSGPPQTSTLTYDTIETFDEAVAMPCGAALESWAEVEYEPVFEEDPWQTIAVDYKADGSVVYAYGRIASGFASASGDFNADPGNDTTTTVSGDTFQVTYTARGDGEWNILADETPAGNSVNIEALSQAWSFGSTALRSTIDYGIRIGTAEVLATSSKSEASNATWSHGFTGGSRTIDGTNSPLAGGATGIATTGPVYKLGFSGSGAGGGAQLSPPWVTEHETCSATRTLVQSNDVVYVAHMDLRYDALFCVIQRTERTVLEANSYVWERDVGTAGTAPEEGEYSVADQKRITWITRGWIHGDPVLEDAIVTLDTFGNAPVTAGPIYHPSNKVASSLGAHRSPSWTLLPAHPADPTTGLFPYLASRTAAPPSGEAYPQTQTEFPFAGFTTMSWQGEVEPDVGELVGYTFGLSNTGRAKAKGHTDLDEMVCLGSWCYLGERWAVSFGLPTDETLDGFRYFSRCGIGPIATQAKTDATAEHFFPIWVLEQTEGFVVSSPAQESTA